MRILMVAHSNAVWTPHFVRFFTSQGHALIVVSFSPEKLDGVDIKFVGIDPYDRHKNKHMFFTRVPPIRGIICRVERVSSGPDDMGIEMLGAAALGFRRLSIIDLASSHQPMANEDDTIWLVFNGEIYNYKGLRQSLKPLGHTFKTEGDGETVLHLYEEHGLGFTEYLNGMFAVGIWDARRQRLVLARDRLGIKPLYYALVGDRLVFASETKSIIEADGLSRTLDMRALVGYMNYMSIPGELTSFKDVHRLLPGHMAVFDRSGFKSRQYWDVSYENQRNWKAGELQDAIEETLRDAVRLRMVSDVPLGSFLSGGVDSSLIAALMAEFSEKPVEAFSVGYGKEGAYMSELPYSKAVTDRYAMNHHNLILDSENLLQDLEQVVWHLDEPCGDPSAFLTLALSRFARQYVTVSLSGLGADELFGGYRRYVGIKWQSRYLKIPAIVRQGLIRPLVGLLPESSCTSHLFNCGRLAKKFLNSVDKDIHNAWAKTITNLPDYDGPIFTGDMESVMRETYTSDAFESYWARVSNLPSVQDRVMYMDMKMCLVDQLLALQDKMSMAVSLESRVPYLDHRLVELAATIPAKMKIPGGRMKAVLKKLAEKYVPHECIYRSKKGFSAPIEAWLKGSMREHVYDLLSPRRIQERGVFQVDFIEWAKREFYEKGRYLSIQLYQACVLETWFRLFVDGEGRKYSRGTPV